MHLMVEKLKEVSPVVAEAHVLRCAELLQQLARLHQGAAAAALGGFGVSDAGSGLLWLLGAHDQVSMGAVAQQLSCDPSNVTLLAAALEDLALVQRVTDPDDRRRRLLRHVPALRGPGIRHKQRSRRSLQRSSRWAPRPGWAPRAAAAPDTSLPVATCRGGAGGWSAAPGRPATR